MPRTQQIAGHAKPQRLGDRASRGRHATPPKRRKHPCPHARSCGQRRLLAFGDRRCSCLRRTASVAPRYVPGKSIPLRYSRKSGVAKIKEISWLKKAVIARPRSRKLQQEIPSQFTRPECFHEWVFAGDCSNRHTGSQSPLSSRFFYCATFASCSPI
jgi:hypothetical protein